MPNVPHKCWPQAHTNWGQHSPKFHVKGCTDWRQGVQADPKVPSLYKLMMSWSCFRILHLASVRGCWSQHLKWEIKAKKVPVQHLVYLTAEHIHFDASVFGDWDCVWGCVYGVRVCVCVYSVCVSMHTCVCGACICKWLSVTQKQLVGHNITTTASKNHH